MNRLFIAIISMLIVSTSSCSILERTVKKVNAENVTEQPKAEKRPEQKFIVGDHVVARWTPGSWSQGRIQSLNPSTMDPKEVNVLWDDGSNQSTVDIADVFLLPAAGNEEYLHPGDYALVHNSTDVWWNGAEILEVGKTVIKAKLIFGDETVNLAPDKVLAVNDTTAAYLKDAAAKEEFLDRAHEQYPVATPGYIPKPGDHILGAWTSNSWYGGKVKAVKGNKATIVWENGMKPDDAFLEKIVPYPTAGQSGPVPSVGDFVLVKPANHNPQAAWIYAQVTSVDGSGIEAKDVDETRVYKAGDYIKLER